MTAAPEPPEETRVRRPPNRIEFVILFGIVLLLATLLVNRFRSGPAPAAPSASPAPPTTAPTPEPPLTFASEFPPLAPLPEVPYPPDNPYTPEKAELGELLYFDTRMSGDGSLSCNSCHPASDGSWGISSPISFGYPGSTHWRNASTIINSAYYARLNWDGSATSIEKQNHGAWTGAVAGNVDSAMAEERLAQIPEYVRRFNEVFGTEYPAYTDALKAVATFQRTIVSQDVPFDAFLGGDEGALSDEAKRGYALFIGEAKCAACHHGPLISDDSFHSLGVPEYSGFEDNALNQITFRFEQLAKGATEDLYASATQDLGLYYITKLESDIGKFRTPGLRDACYTAPYMHNGAFGTLEEVVAFYNEGGGESPNKAAQLQPLGLSPQQQSDLVAFLTSLCGERLVLEAPDLPPYETWDSGGG